MKKKFYILCLTMAFVMSIAGTGWASFEYVGDTIIDEETGEMFTYTFAASGDITDPVIQDEYSDTAGYGIGGYNYYTQIRLPVMNLHEVYQVDDEADEEENDIPESEMTIEWNIETDGGLSGLKKTLTNDDAGKFFILSGKLPETAGDYNFYVTAKITAVENEDYKRAVGINVSSDVFSISITEDSNHTLYTSGSSFDKNITPNKNIETVGSNYKVVVNAPYTEKTTRSGTKREYSQYIESGDIGDPTTFINLPHWLTYTIETITDDEYGDTKVTSATITFNKKYEGKVPDGATGSVRVPFVDTDGNETMTLGWNVTYNESEPTPAEDTPFKFTEEVDLKFSLEPGKESSFKVSYTGSRPTECEYSERPEAFKNNIDVDNPKVGDDGITINVKAKPTAKTGTYTATLKFTDAKGNSDTAKITVEVKASTTPTTPTNPTSNDEKPEPEPEPEPENIETKSEDVKPAPENPINFHEIESGDKPLSNDEKPAPTPTPSRTSRDIQPGNNNNNNTPSGERSIKAISATPKQSKLDINNETIKNNIANAFGIDFVAGEKLQMPVFGNSRTSGDVQNLIPSSGDVKIIVLPVIQFVEGVNVFALERNDFENAEFRTGQKLYILYEVINSSALGGSLFASAGNEFKLVNSQGKEITEFPTDSNEEINVVALIETPQTYSMIISSASNTTGETASVTITSNDITPSALGPSGAGCDTGINFATLLIVVAGFIFRKKLR